MSDGLSPYTLLMIDVALLLMPGTRLFDVSIVTETWAAKRLSSPDLNVDLRRCAINKGMVELTDSSQAMADETLEWAQNADLVLIPGLGDFTATPPNQYLETIREAHQRGAVVASLCSGAFVLAQTGLLDGLTATTHWALTDELASRFLEINVDPAVLFVVESRVWTSAGVAAGIDLSIHLIGQFCGSSVASTIARSMVMAPHRTGGQAQFLTTPVAVKHGDGQAMTTVRTLMMKGPTRTLTLSDFAGEACMSERTFLRRFLAETGSTPHQWAMSWRIDEACKLLEESHGSIAEVSAAVGFGTPVTFRQRFRALKGVSPMEYRQAFRKPE